MARGPDDVYMYMWHEGQAGIGSQEIGSCVLKHLQQNAAGERVFNTYSDSCGGQNRNVNIVLLWSYAVARLGIQEVNHKFIVSGQFPSQ